MTLGTVLALVILVSFLITMVLAVGSYATYKIREARRPRPIFHSDAAFQFFERYLHTAEAEAARERRVAEAEADGTLDETLPA